MARAASFKITIALTHPTEFFVCLEKPHQLPPFVLFMRTFLKLQDS